MKSRIFQIIFIILAISAIAGGYFYFSSNAAETLRDSTIGSPGATKKINASQVGKVTSGLVGHWTFDGADMNALAPEVQDKAGSNHGTLTGTTKAIGKIGQALDFNGISDKVSVSAAVITQAVSFWMKADTVTSKEIIKINGNCKLEINGSSNMVGTGSDCSSPTFYKDSAVASSVDAGWHHFVAVFPSAITTLNPFTIGTAGGSYFDGQIDEVRIYNRALSQSEITELYQQGQTKINASQADKLTNGLAGYWTMDGQDVNWGATKEILDRSGNGNDGDVNGLTTASAVPGKIGQALSFTPLSTNAITVTDSGTTLDPTTAITISAWVNLKSSSSAYPYIVSKCTGGACPSNGFRLNLDNAGNCNETPNGIFDLNFMYGNGAVCADDVITPGTGWHHLSIVSVAGSSAATFYLDGQVISSYVIYGSFSAADNTTPLTIGNRSLLTAFSGLDIDEIRIYSRALSASEVTELYNQGR